jgi:hypothetical protein
LKSICARPKIVAQGEEHIRKQRRRILTELERDDHPAETAREILRNYENLQLTHIQHRDIIKRELTAVRSGSL